MLRRLVDLVHEFKGVVVEQFKKRLEKLLSDSILLWRLLKLLFKILHYLSFTIHIIIRANKATFQIGVKCLWDEMAFG